MRSAPHGRNQPVMG